MGHQPAGGSLNGAAQDPFCPQGIADAEGMAQALLAVGTPRNEVCGVLMDQGVLPMDVAGAMFLILLPEGASEPARSDNVGPKDRINFISKVWGLANALVPVIAMKREAVNVRAIFERHGINPWTAIMAMDTARRSPAKAQVIASAMGLDGSERWKESRGTRSSHAWLDETLTESVLGRGGILVAPIDVHARGLGRWPAASMFIRDLSLNDTQVDNLPDRVFAHAIAVNGAPNLKRVDQGLVVGGLRLQACAALESLTVPWSLMDKSKPGAGRHSDGLSLVDMANLVEIDAKGGALACKEVSIVACPRLRRVPGSLETQGILRIAHCPQLQALADKVETKHLEVTGCDGLVSLGRDVRVERDARIQGCRNFVTPGGTFHVGELHLRDCDGFRSLGGGTVDGAFILEHGGRIPSTWDGDIGDGTVGSVYHGPAMGWDEATWRARFARGGVGLDGYTDSEREAMAQGSAGNGTTRND